MRSRHSVEEKFEIVMEALTEILSQAEICRRHGIFPIFRRNSRIRGKKGWREIIGGSSITR